LALKILYLNPDPPGMYRYYSDLYNRLRKMANCESDDPDVIVYGPTWLNQERGEIQRDKPQVCFVHKIGLDWERKEKFLKQCDLVLSSVPKLPIKHRLFKYAADPNIFSPGDKKLWDVGFSGALHNEENYPEGTFPIPNLRKRSQDILRESGLNCFLNGSDSIRPRISSYAKYAEVMAKSKIWLATTGPNGDIGPRYYEPALTKALLFCDPPPEEYRDTFRDGENCVYFDLDNLIEKAEYYLENEKERKRIVNRAFGEFMTHHTWTARSWELIDICSGLCG
jgi:hypothetical protein